MRYLLILLFALAARNAGAFDVYALGTSNTNCKNSDQAYTRKLNELLPFVRVINGGIDGDKPVWMLHRLKSTLQANPEIKLVIFEPGPNDTNKRSNIESSAEILQFLQSIQMTTVYVSHRSIQNKEEGRQFAEKYGAYYYGPWTLNVPIDREHRLYDYPPGTPGHMTVKGCELWATQMADFLKKIIEDKQLLP